MLQIRSSVSTVQRQILKNVLTLILYYDRVLAYEKPEGNCYEKENSKYHVSSNNDTVPVCRMWFQ